MITAFQFPRRNVWQQFCTSLEHCIATLNFCQRGCYSHKCTDGETSFNDTKSLKNFRRYWVYTIWHACSLHTRGLLSLTYLMLSGRDDFIRKGGKGEL